jgi:hypothetical protein
MPRTRHGRRDEANSPRLSVCSRAGWPRRVAVTRFLPGAHQHQIQGVVRAVQAAGVAHLVLRGNGTDDGEHRRGRHPVGRGDQRGGGQLAPRRSTGGHRSSSSAAPVRTTIGSVTAVWRVTVLLLVSAWRRVLHRDSRRSGLVSSGPVPIAACGGPGGAVPGSRNEPGAARERDQESVNHRSGAVGIASRRWRRRHRRRPMRA